MHNERSEWIFVVMFFLFAIFHATDCVYSSEWVVTDISYVLYFPYDYYFMPYVTSPGWVEQNEIANITVDVYKQHVDYYSYKYLYTTANVSTEVTLPDDSADYVEFYNLNNGSYYYNYTFALNGTYKFKLRVENWTDASYSSGYIFIYCSNLTEESTNETSNETESTDMPGSARPGPYDLVIICGDNTVYQGDDMRCNASISNKGISKTGATFTYEIINDVEQTIEKRTMDINVTPRTTQTKEIVYYIPANLEPGMYVLKGYVDTGTTLTFAQRHFYVRLSSLKPTVEQSMIGTGATGYNQIYIILFVVVVLCGVLFNKKIREFFKKEEEY